MAEPPVKKLNRLWTSSRFADRCKRLKPRDNLGRLFFTMTAVDDIVDHMSGIGHARHDDILGRCQGLAMPNIASAEYFPDSTVIAVPIKHQISSVSSRRSMTLTSTPTWPVDVC
jgi:hypothetical protein